MGWRENDGRARQGARGMETWKMTQEQWLILVRDCLKVGGTVAGMLGVATTQVDQVTSMILMAAGPMLALGGIVWGQLLHTPAGIVSQASRLDEVKEISVTTKELATAAKEASPTTIVHVKPQF